MQWSSVVPNEYAIGKRQGIYLTEPMFLITSQGGFKAALICSFLDLTLSFTLLMIMLTSSPVLLSPPPPRLLMLPDPYLTDPNLNLTSNETSVFPSNMSDFDMPMERTFYCEKIGRKVELGEFLAQVIYTGGAAAVVFGALTKRVSCCYMHFPCSLIAIILGIGNRIIEVIYCKWFLMRWLRFVIQFAWYSLGDVVAKSLTVYMENKENRVEILTQGKLIVPNT